ncbi:hypothetical protein HK101_003547 [Irineochytrium annulatum]|nr:hypothetical protein HK101_003547 [Irineochytrium annulatum]
MDTRMGLSGELLQHGQRANALVCSENIKYSLENENLALDVHCNDNDSALKPVIVFIYGGAWSSGNKAMYGPLANTLQKHGYVVVVPNYTLFPNGRVGNMVGDIACAIWWVYDNIKKYGGDPDHIHLMGHSAGAHLCALTVIHDVASHLETRYQEGLARYSKENFDISSPAVILRRVDREVVESGQLARLLPKQWLIVHGDLDTTVPPKESFELHHLLRHDLGIQNAKLKVYPKVDHMRPVVGL